MITNSNSRKLFPKPNDMTNTSKFYNTHRPLNIRAYLNNLRLD